MDRARLSHDAFEQKKTPADRGFSCERYWDRTSDLFRVREARYRCANRSNRYEIIFLLEVATGFEPVWTALQAAASPLGHATAPDTFASNTVQTIPLERMTRFELATLTLAR
jgi:hypothetical protein